MRQVDVQRQAHDRPRPGTGRGCRARRRSSSDDHSRSSVDRRGRCAVTAAAATIVVPAPAAGGNGDARRHRRAAVRLVDGDEVRPAGGTGLDVLTRGFPDTRIGSSGPYAGFVLQINGVGQNPPDDTHYWSYWHSTGNRLVDLQRLRRRLVHAEGGDGRGLVVRGRAERCAQAGRATATTSCAAAADPTRSPTPTHHPATRLRRLPGRLRRPHRRRRSLRRGTTAARIRRCTLRPPRYRTPSSTTRAAQPPPSRAPTPVRGAVRLSARWSPRTRGPRLRTRLRQRPLATPTISNAAAASTQQASSGFPAWGTVVALVVILALGGGAWLRLRRRPE